MAHTQDAVIVDATGIVHMVVIPDDDSQLEDPAFDPVDYTRILVAHDPLINPVVAAGAIPAYVALNIRLPCPPTPVNLPAPDIAGNTTRLPDD